MPQNMKSVMIFDPSDSDKQTATKFVNWIRQNKPSSMGDKYVPNVAETRKYLESLRSS